MPRTPLILLPPSEGKAPGGDGPPWSAGSMAVDLDRQRATVLTALRRAMREDEVSRARLLDVKGKALAAATATDLAVRRAPTLPAIERYTGVLYDALDARSLTRAERRRLEASVVIFSGLWGLVAPGDPIPDYKLKMGARLGSLGVLSAWWRDDLTTRLASLAAGRRVWNLLPNEHAAAWRPPAELSQWSVRFLDRAPDGGLVAVSHRNKALKGALVRFLTAHPSAEPEDLVGWEHPDGYRLQPTLTEGHDGTTVLSLVRDEDR